MRPSVRPDRERVFRVALARSSIEHAGGMRWSRLTLEALLLAMVVCAFAPAADARKKSLAFFPPRPERLRAFRYAGLSKKDCLAELELRKIPFQPAAAKVVKKARTVEAPVHLVGALHGVRFEHAHPPATPREGPLMDCRLLLALDDLATIAGDRGITTVRYNSTYRRGWGKKGHRHPAGVAIDIVGFVKDGGHELVVLDDFDGSGIGSKTCGDGATPAPEGKARELRELVCALHSAHVFNLILSPHYDRRHKDHLHLEVRRGIKWFLTQ
jgi:hypothetical protein